MTKRRLLITGSLVACVGLMLGVGLWILPEPDQPISYVPREKFGRIQEGMTEAEVEAILGQPGTLDGIYPQSRKKDPERWMIWQVDDREWAVMGFQNDCVSTGTSWRIYSREPSIFDKIRHWLQLGLILSCRAAEKTGLTSRCTPTAAA